MTAGELILAIILCLVFPIGWLFLIGYFILLALFKK